MSRQGVLLATKASKNAAEVSFSVGSASIFAHVCANSAHLRAELRRVI